ncbi:hypothetical protein [uncultured Ruegeria sp.]|uniref:hypothetical protein n=1 Tax=uncultured Ruegeria sp. TaxID=259304 RepID=UPI002617A1A9|nr:hypothetical protein [uncultured Ruegeria sp.]
MADTLPTDIVRSIESRTLAAAAVPVTSPFTGSQQIQDWGGSWWEYSIAIKVQHDEAGRSLSAFLAKLRGPVNPFLFNDPSLRQTESYGTPLVDGAGQSGNTLVTDGWSATGLKAGDFFSLGSDEETRFYQLTADVVPIAGAATLEFVPALRSSPGDDAALEVSNPRVLLRATSPLPANIQAGDMYRFSFTAREAI